MITGLRGATIWSEDLNRLLPFYRDVLGLPVTLLVDGCSAPFVTVGAPRLSQAYGLGTGRRR